ncbi:ImmA/IrrE family metallo-endopeptidase [Leucobacter sp. GX24907]
MRQKLLNEARRRGVAVIYGTLPAPYRSLYRSAKNLIIIGRGLTEAQEVEALAHELGHAHYGHDCTTDRSEAQAWRWAARFVINHAAYARAEYLHHHPAAIAHALGITPKLVLAWQQHYGRFPAAA